MFKNTRLNKEWLNDVYSNRKLFPNLRMDEEENGKAERKPALSFKNNLKYAKRFLPKNLFSKLHF